VHPIGPRLFRLYPVTGQSFFSPGDSMLHQIRFKKDECQKLKLRKYLSMYEVLLNRFHRSRSFMGMGQPFPSAPHAGLHYDEEMRMRGQIRYEIV